MTENGRKLSKGSNGQSSFEEETGHLAELLKDKKTLINYPNLFIHIERLLDEEINRIRLSLLNSNSKAVHLQPLPEQEGPIVTLSEKIFIPVKKYPDFNFVGRILGPRGMTAKQLEQETSCRIMIRGRSSMRDKAKEEQNRGKPNWEHLNEDLHVLITVEDTQARSVLKLERAVKEIKKLLVPSVDGEDDLKKLQLMELAILNGTYREENKKSVSRSYSTDTTGSATPLMFSPMATPFTCPVYYTSQPLNASPGQSPVPQQSLGMMGYVPANTFVSQAEVPAFFYVDPYSTITGSAYFESTQESTPKKSNPHAVEAASGEKEM